VQGRLKEWFARVPQSVVLLRPDRFVAGMCTPQQVSASIEELAVKLSFKAAGPQAAAVAASEPVEVCDSVAAVATVAAGA
jgi:3-(3-hydroxy-phenyl)propionate hydroxylase